MRAGDDYRLVILVHFIAECGCDGDQADTLQQREAELCHVAAALQALRTTAAQDAIGQQQSEQHLVDDIAALTLPLSNKEALDEGIQSLRKLLKDAQFQLTAGQFKHQQEQERLMDELKNVREETLEALTGKGQLEAKLYQTELASQALESRLVDVTKQMEQLTRSTETETVRLTKEAAAGWTRAAATDELYEHSLAVQASLRLQFEQHQLHFESELHKSAQTIQTLEARLNDQRQEVEAELHQSQQTIHTLQSRLSDQQQQMDVELHQSEQMIQTLEARLSDQQHRLEIARHQSEQLTSRLSDQQQHMDTALHQSEQTIQTLESRLNKQQQVEADLQQSQQTTQTLEARLNDQQQQMDAALYQSEETIQTLRARLSEQQQAEAELQRTLDVVEGHCRALTVELNTLR